MSKVHHSTTFTFHYQPYTPIFATPPGKPQKRQSKAWMTGASMGADREWVPGLQRTFLGACWAAWKLQRRMKKGLTSETPEPYDGDTANEGSIT